MISYFNRKPLINSPTLISPLYSNVVLLLHELGGVLYAKLLEDMPHNST